MAKHPRDLVVGDVMAEAPVTAAPEDSVADLEAEMDRSDIRHLPIVDNGKVVGILSDRDVCRARKTQKAAALMSEDVMTVMASTRLCEASALMLDHRISALPVIDSGGALVGIITNTDFLRIAHQVCGGDALAVDD